VNGVWSWLRRDRPRRDLCLLALVAACVVLPGLGRRDLWKPDEPRYAEVAREMEGGLLFYGTGFARELWSDEEVRAHLSGRRVWLVEDPDEARKIGPPAGYVVIARQGGRDDGVRILAPAAETAR